MANLTLIDSKILIGPYDLSGYANQLSVDFTAEMLDVSVFDGSTTRRFRPGLTNVELTASGFNDYDRTTPTSSGIDDRIYGLIGGVGIPATLAPISLAEGGRAFTFRNLVASYMPVSGSVGEMAAFELSGRANGTRLVQGTVVGTGAKSTTGNTTTPPQLGLLATGKKLYAALHCVAASGTTPTCDVIIESDDAVGFPSPVTRITFTQLTTTGSEWKELSGPVATDTYWRAKWTIGGGTPSFTIHVVIGIH